MTMFSLVSLAIITICTHSAANISCPQNDSCVVNCESQSCQHSKIDATLSTSLHVSCGNCESTIILCPSTSEYSDCIIDIDKKGINTSWTTRRSWFMDIRSFSNNNMRINVDHESSFHHSSILCGDNSICSLNCNQIETCLNIQINTTFNSNLTVNCNGISSCNYLDGSNYINSNDDDKWIDIECTDYTRCHWAISNVSGDILINTTAPSYESKYNLPIYMKLDAVNSNSLQINIENTKFIANGIYNNMQNGIYANNSKSIKLNIGYSDSNNYYGHYIVGNGYFEGNIFGENAKLFELNCGGNKESCSNGKYYISSNKSIINCHQYGCWDLNIYSMNGLKNVMVIENNNCICDNNSTQFDNSCIAKWDIFCGNNYMNHSMFINGNQCKPSICCKNETIKQFLCIKEGGNSTIKPSKTVRILIVIAGFIGLCLISGGLYRCGTTKNNNNNNNDNNNNNKQAFIN